MLYDPALLFVVRLPPAARSANNMYHIDNASLVLTGYGMHRRDNCHCHVCHIRANYHPIFYFLYML
jgi:hypothetical protein